MVTSNYHWIECMSLGSVALLFTQLPWIVLKVVGAETQSDAHPEWGDQAQKYHLLKMKPEMKERYLKPQIC